MRTKFTKAVPRIESCFYDADEAAPVGTLGKDFKISRACSSVRTGMIFRP